MAVSPEITAADLKIKLTENKETRERVYRFRHNVYVGEMGKSLESSDNDGLLFDELDDTARIYYIEVKHEIIATIRVNLYREGGFNDFIYTHCGVSRLKQIEDKLSYTSKLMVAPEWRQSMLLGKILNHVYTEARALGVKIDFCYCAPSLVAYYELLGYRRYKDNFIDPEVGYRIPMALLIEDAVYMRTTGSPFYRIARNFENSQEEIDIFQNIFSSDKYFVSSKLKNSDYFWSKFSNTLRSSSIDLFKSMERDCIDSFIKRCTVISCKAGDNVVRDGEVGKEMFVILSGAAEVRKVANNKEIVLATFGQGQIFGEMAFVSHIKRTADVVAITDLEVLVLTQELFHVLLKQIPEDCAKVLLNLSSILCDRLRLSTELLHSISEN
ncbi:MAG: CRP-like cAMP-binding protein [Candidatus Omnitrophota bacterium]